MEIKIELPPEGILRIDIHNSQGCFGGVDMVIPENEESIDKALDLIKKRLLQYIAK